MNTHSDASAQAVALPFREVGGARALLRPVVPRTAAQTVVAAAIVPMVVVTLLLALTSEHLQRPAAAGVYWSYQIAASMLVGLYWWTGRPGSRFGPLLIAFGALFWVVSWQGANAPLAFDIGVLAEAPMWLLTIYLFLAFPTGRIEPRAARWTMVALGVGAMASFVPWALTAPVVAGGGPLTGCAPKCPASVIQVASSPEFTDVVGKLETYLALTLVAAVFVIYLGRLLTASVPQRRALLAVAVTSLLWVPAYFASNFAAWILELDPATLDALAWGIVVTRILLPLGFLFALLGAERFAAKALRSLLDGLAAKPTPARWRDAIARALDDSSLKLGFTDPSTGQFRDPSGRVMTPPPAASGAGVGAGRARSAARGGDGSRRIARRGP